MKKHASWLLIAAAATLILQGCNQASQPAQPTPTPAGQTATQQPQTQPSGSQTAPTTQQPTTTQPSSGGQAATQPAASQGTVDLTPELKLNPAMVLGKTTYTELEMRFGKAEDVKDHKTAFRMGLSNPQSKYPQVVNISAKFHINPLTGQKMNETFPYYFTKDDKKVLVAAQTVLRRGDLLVKEKNHTITLDDIKKVYGEPLRETPIGMEYYDFNHKIALQVIMRGKGKFAYMLTKYDVLYGDDTQDLQKHEEKIKELAAKTK